MFILSLVPFSAVEPLKEGCLGPTSDPPAVYASGHFFRQLSPCRDSATAWAALGLLLLPYASCFLRWNLLHLPKPSMNGTEKPSFLPLTLYYHLTFPDGMSNSVKPLTCWNCQPRSRHQALHLHMPQTPWSMSSLPRAPLHSPIHSISATGEWTACWLVGQWTLRPNYPPSKNPQSIQGTLSESITWFGGEQKVFHLKQVLPIGQDAKESNFPFHL